MIVELTKTELIIDSSVFKPVLFEFMNQAYSYDYRTKKRTWTTTRCKLYEKRNRGAKYAIPLGMCTYFLNTHYNELDESTRQILLNFILNDKVLVTDFMHLRDDQKHAVEQLSKVKRGVLSIYTGWGKTEVMSVITQNLLKNAEGNILIIGTKNMITDELKSRLQSRIDYTPQYFDPDGRVNVLNPSGFCASGIYKSGQADKWLSNVRFVLMDEVDRISNQTGDLLKLLEANGCEYFYGMSATADKHSARRIPADSSLIEMMNWDLASVVRTFSHSVVHLRPDNFMINIRKVSCGKMDLSFMNNVSENTLSYDLQWYTATSPLYLKFLGHVMSKCRPLVPMYYTTIIDRWIEYFKDKRVIVLSGSGYNYYVNGELQESLTIDELKDAVKLKDFDVIFTTVTGFSAIDLPDLEDVVLLSGNQANAVIQYIGRVSRNKAFTIWYADFSNKIPTYSSRLSTQLELITEYYNNCKISKIDERLS